jgi:hypothetical protein
MQEIRYFLPIVTIGISNDRVVVRAHAMVDYRRLQSTADDYGHGRLQSTAGGPGRSSKKSASPGLS